MARSPRPNSNPRPSMEGFKKTSPWDLFWDLLTFDRLMTGPVIHLIYWAGLAILVLGGFATIGAAAGVAWREENMLMKVGLVIPVVVAGFLMLAAGALLWRSFCEFYVAIFRISDDLRFIRGSIEQGQPLAPAAPAPELQEPAAPPVAQPELPIETPQPSGRVRMKPT